MIWLKRTASGAVLFGGGVFTWWVARHTPWWLFALTTIAALAVSAFLTALKQELEERRRVRRQFERSAMKYIVLRYGHHRRDDPAQPGDSGIPDDRQALYVVSAPDGAQNRWDTEWVRGPRGPSSDAGLSWRTRGRPHSRFVRRTRLAIRFCASCVTRAGRSCESTARRSPSRTGPVRAPTGRPRLRPGCRGASRTIKRPSPHQGRAHDSDRRVPGSR